MIDTAYIERDIFINTELIPLVKTLDLCHPKQKKGVLMAISKLRETPSADVVEVRHGYWYITEYEYINCSKCGHMHYTGMDSTDQAKQNLIDGKVPNYCPNCGAKMDGKDGE